jgi:hypothetical protein
MGWSPILYDDLATTADTARALVRQRAGGIDEVRGRLDVAGLLEALDVFADWVVVAARGVLLDWLELELAAAAVLLPLEVTTRSVSASRKMTSTMVPNTKSRRRQ